MSSTNFSAANLLVGTRVGLGGLTKGLSDAGGKLTSFASGVSQKFGKFDLGKALVGGLAAFGAFKGFSFFEDLRKGAAESLDEIGALSEKVGASASNLAGLQYAAKLANVEQAGLSSSLTKLGINLGQIASGGGQKAADALAQLGLNASDLAKMDRVEAFKAIAEQISKIPNPAQQSAAAVALLGKSGADLLPLMAQGAAGIAEAQEQASKLGIVSKNMDAGVQQVNASNDAWDKMMMTISGIGTQLAIAVAPAFTAIFNTISEVIGQANAWFQAQGDGSNFIIGALGMVGKAFGVVADVIHTVKLGWIAAQSLLTTGLGNVLGGVALVVKGFQDLLNLIPGVHKEFGDFLETYSADLKRLGADQWENFNKELAKEPPSTGINKWFDNLKAQAFEAQEVAAATKQDWSVVGDMANASAQIASEKGASSKQGAMFAGALEMGSAEARSAILAFRQNASGSLVGLANTAKASLDVQQKMLVGINRIADQNDEEDLF